MHCSELVVAHDYVVALDYGTFHLYTSETGFEHDLDLLGDADGGIAQGGGSVAVCSPHQNNFKMPLRVEVWDAAPAADIDEWQEAFEVHLDVGDAGLTYESPTCDHVRLPVPPGSYHALITGRGFVAIGWPGSTTPGDSWRIRLWPSAGPPAPRQLRAYEEPRIHHPDPVSQDVGIAAVHRLHEALDADLANTGQLSGERGTATAARRIPGTRRRLYRSFRNPAGWLTSMSRGGAADTYWLYAGDYHREHWGDPNRIVPCNGEIQCDIVDAKSPAYAVATWTWRRRPPDRIAPANRDGQPGADLLPNPCPTLRFDLESAGLDDGTPLTLVRVTHDHVPVEWVDDLAAYWLWMLERADYDFDLSDARRDGYRN